MSITRQFYMAAQPLGNFKPFKSAWVSPWAKSPTTEVTVSTKKSSTKFYSLEVIGFIFMELNKKHLFVHGEN